MGKNLIPFRWYGGKYSVLDFIIPNLPRTRRYVEPFGGSAVVLVNRKPSPIEVYNDIDKDIVTFFKVLREQKDELLEQIALTPFSREELRRAVEQENNDDLGEVEQARQFFVRVTQTRLATAQQASEGRWAYSRSLSRREVAQNASRYYGRLKQLEPVAQRLMGVQIESRTAIDVIQEFDSEETLFYCDPPYPHGTRVDTSSYAYEMSDDEHQELADVLRECEGKVAISGYQCDLYEELYENHGWTRIDNDEITTRSETNRRPESLWTNYDPPDRDTDIAAGQQSIDDY